MPLVTMPTLSTPAPLAASNDRDDLTVLHRLGADDEHRLVLALLEDCPQLARQFGQADVLMLMLMR
jgi:hypothetical protein